MEQYFQGDLMFMKIADTKEELAQRGEDIHKPKSDISKIVLAVGEKTGHAHVVDTQTSDIVGVGPLWGGNTAIVVGENGATVEHTGNDSSDERHGNLSLPRGVYEVVRQRRWVYEEEPKQVVD